MSDSNSTNDDLKDILEIKKEKLLSLKNEGKDPFYQVKFNVTTYTKDICDNFNEIEGKIVNIAGRLMTRRIMGKASFCDILDKKGKIQLYIRKNEVGEDFYEEFKKYDLGDILGIKGIVFKTQKGEISIKVNSLTLLAKSLQILPEKFHGLKDQEIRYRQRYLDLIVNPEVREIFEKRSIIIKSIREFLDNKGYMEVETPILQTKASGASAKPFMTHHNTLNLDMYMRISPELYLKRLIVGGFDKIYEIGRVFRNEGLSIKHNPEFTLLELYESYTDYKKMMELTENLIKYVSNKILNSYIVKAGDKIIDLSKPFEKITMVDAVKKYVKIDFNNIETLEQAQKIAEEKNIKYEKYHKKGDILNLLFEEFVEDKLIDPTFILDHPVEISPLTKRKQDNKEYTERFELFILGREFANAYSELNDPIDQRERFKEQEKLKKVGNDEANMIDEEFITALEYGMPPTGGLGIGIDRLVMFITNSISIRDVLFFPTMKPIK